MSTFLTNAMTPCGSMTCARRSCWKAILTNIAKDVEWIDSRRRARGNGTDPSDSLKSAFTHKPTELFLLTDGEFRVRKDEPTIRQLIQSLNSAKATKINTLAIGDSLQEPKKPKPL